MTPQEIHNRITKREYKHSNKVCGEVSASVHLCEHAFKCHMRVRSEAKQHRYKTHIWLTHQFKASSSQPKPLEKCTNTQAYKLEKCCEVNTSVWHT